jgi:hypothetical protein
MSDPLAAYLQDHLAGAAHAIELTRASSIACAQYSNLLLTSRVQSILECTLRGKEFEGSLKIDFQI